MQFTQCIGGVLKQPFVSTAACVWRRPLDLTYPPAVGTGVGTSISLRLFQPFLLLSFIPTALRKQRPAIAPIASTMLRLCSWSTSRDSDFYSRGRKWQEARSPKL